jgi:hypothetical protein
VSARLPLGVLLAAVSLAGGSNGTAAVATSTDTAILRFHGGRETLSFRLREPDGVILLYRLTAPRGVKARASVMLPGVTVPLFIATRRTGPSSSCRSVGPRVRCTVGEEWCPMPQGTWHGRVEKLEGPAGYVIITFRVGNPAGRRA